MKPRIMMVGPLPVREMEALRRDFEICPLWEAENPRAFLEQHGAAIRAAITRSDLGFDAETMEGLPNLELIACFGVGVDRIDVDHATRRGVRVTNTPGVLTDDVADMALALILALLRQVCAGDQHVRSGAWGRRTPFSLGRSLGGKRVGIFGFGRIGQAIARRLGAFNADVSYCDLVESKAHHFTYYSSIGDLASQSDILVLSAAGVEATRRIVDEDVLRALGKSGWLINVARGSLVDEVALINALNERVIAGAALDVFDNEPAIDPRLMLASNLLVQPHQASATVETRGAMGELVRKNLNAHFGGIKPLSPVN